MASKGATKRLASAAPKTDRPLKKNKHVADIVTVKCRRIANAIEDSSLPDHVKEMLEASVGGCLRSYKQDRHDYQNQLLDMVSEALEQSKASCNEKLEAAQAIVTRSTEDKEMEERQNNVASAESTMAKLRAELDEKRTGQSADVDAVKTAIGQRKIALAAQKNADKGSEDVMAKKEKVAASIETLSEFKEKAGTTATIKKFVKGLLDAGLEKTLLDAVPSVLQKSPDARGTFGNLVIEQLQTQITKHMESFAPAIEELAPGIAERAAAVTSAEEDVKAAEEKRDASAAEVQSAAAALKEADIALAAARNAVEDRAPELQRAQRDLEGASAALKALEEGALTDFAELLEHAPAAEPVAGEPAGDEKPDEEEEPCADTAVDSPAIEEGGA